MVRAEETALLEKGSSKSDHGEGSGEEEEERVGGGGKRVQSDHNDEMINS